MQLAELGGRVFQRLRVDAKAALFAAERFPAQLDDNATITQVRFVGLHGVSLLPGGFSCNLWLSRARGERRSSKHGSTFSLSIFFDRWPFGRLRSTQRKQR